MGGLLLVHPYTIKYVYRCWPAAAGNFLFIISFSLCCCCWLLVSYWNCHLSTIQPASPPARSRPSSICCRIPQHLWMYAYTSVYITYREEEEEEARKRKYMQQQDAWPLLYTVWRLSGSPLNDGSSLEHHRVERSSARIVRPSVSCSLLLLTPFGDLHSSTHSPSRAQHI